MSKQYTLYVRVPTLPSHGKACMEIYASNYRPNVWSDNPQYAVPFSRKMAKELSDYFQRVLRVDVRIKEYPPVPESDSINA